MSQRYEGVLAYPVTALHADGDSLDLGAYEKLLDRMMRGGVSAMIPLGSTGEFAYLSAAERKELASTTVDIVNRRVPVIMGVSALATRDAVGFARHAGEIGADGVMVSFPTYYGLKAAEVKAHVQAIADASDLPIVLYNNPFTSAVDVDVTLLDELGTIDSVVAIKEATFDVNRISSIWSAFGDRFEVLGGGYDPYAFSAMALGVRGWTTGMACLVPEKCVALYEAVALRGDLALGRELHESLLPLADLLIELGLSKALKASLTILGCSAGPTRRPLQPLGERDLSRLKTALELAGAFE